MVYWCNSYTIVNYSLDRVEWFKYKLKKVLNLHDIDSPPSQYQHHDLENQLRILKDFCSNMGMIVNTDKTKVMIIKSNKIPYDTFVYDNNNLEEVTSYKYFGIDIHHKLNWNYSIEKRIIGGWKAYYGLENNCKSADLWSWDNKKLLFETLLHLLFFMDVNYGVVVSLVNLGER
jgi:hypothetical protein